MNFQAKPRKFRTYPLFKRSMDILASLVIILLISPILIGIAVAIRLESKGPIFYISKRVGKNYKVFNFYKFRSMRVGADKMLDKMKHLNQYNKSDSKLEVSAYQIGFDEAPVEMEEEEGNWLISDEGVMEEESFLEIEKEEEKKAFVKIQNDPRITRIGHFIRNTSMDELPQLFNVLLGDMSLVGNRPLPVYEAEKLTSDDWVERFIAPAGITGLWQVTDRGKKNVKNDSRKYLDVEYAKTYNFWLDLWILVKTPLAAIQHENV